MRRTLGMILAELRYRPMNAGLLILVVAAACGLIVFAYTTADGMDNETRLIQKDMGSNLTLIPADADRSTYQMTGVIDTTMPEAVVDQLLAQGAVSMNHLIAVLDRPIELGEHAAILTGIARSRATPGRPKAPMNDGVEPGKVELGFAIARDLGVAKGQTVTLFDHDYEVALVYVEKGTEEDYRIFADLADAQRMLNLPGRINKIQAIDCVSCADPSEEALPILRNELATAAPEAQVLRASNVADARARQRTTLSRYRGILLPIVLAGALIAVAGITMLNVRDRRQEVGVLRSIGKTSPTIGLLFLGKAVALALIGAGVGAGLGGYFAVSRGASAFELSAAKLSIDWALIGWTVGLAPVFAALAAALPALSAMLQDPAQTLRDD